jgi:hypothetical protein
MVKTALPDKQYHLLEAVLSNFAYVMEALPGAQGSASTAMSLLTESTSG